jgi:uncharacterized repeat protein (TIGR03803 family)
LDSIVTFKSLYSFKGNPDGARPDRRLIAADGMLYGTTQNGGGNGGVVYQITTSGAESVLHVFTGGSDGAGPEAGLIDVHGALYSTTIQGGGSGCESGLGCGTVFRITTSGSERVLYHFKGDADGGGPLDSLRVVKGALYGTTSGYGASRGTIFRLTTSGTESVLYSFKGGSDGDYPTAGLIDLNGTLYGTTLDGGAGAGCGMYGCGTVFKITTSGTESVLHSFAGGSDGANPYAGLVDVNGTLYGTTLNGGTTGAGTVFKITPSGTESVLHSFTSSSGDGAYPFAGLLNVNGTLYGTTFYGGTNGTGTVYEITTSGAESVLYSFLDSSDGGYVSAGLIDVNGTLYGAASLGGSFGQGTVFSISL